jgi:hypothetical protein
MVKIMSAAQEARLSTFLALKAYAESAQIGLYDAAIQYTFPANEHPSWEWISSTRRTPYRRDINYRRALQAFTYVHGALGYTSGFSIVNDFYFKEGEEFAKRFPSSVEPRCIETFTASGQKTVWKFRHPQAAELTLKQLEKLPISYFA